MKLLRFLKTGIKFKFLKNTVQTKCELSETHSSPWPWVCKFKSMSHTWLPSDAVTASCHKVGLQSHTEGLLQFRHPFHPGCIQTHTPWAALGNLFFLSSPVLTLTPARLEAQAPSSRVYDPPALGPRPPVMSGTPSKPGSPPYQLCKCRESQLARVRKDLALII